MIPNICYFRHKWEVSAQDIDIDDFSSLESPRLQYASWLPSSAKSSHSGSAIVFVENYSIYYIPDVGKYEKREIFPISSSEEVTDAVIHGIPDWIYEGKRSTHERREMHLNDYPSYPIKTYITERLNSQLQNR